MTTCRKLCLALLLFVGSFPLVSLDGWFALGIPIGLLFSILYWFDLGRELRQAPNGSRGQRIVGLLMGLPQALFGLVCLLCGVVIIAWVLYNSFWERQQNYTGGFMTLGCGPLLLVFGAGQLVDAFRRSAVTKT